MSERTTLDDLGGRSNTGGGGLLPPLVQNADCIENTSAGGRVCVLAGTDASPGEFLIKDPRTGSRDMSFEPQQTSRWALKYDGNNILRFESSSITHYGSLYPNADNAHQIGGQFQRIREIQSLRYTNTVDGGDITFQAGNGNQGGSIIIHDAETIGQIGDLSISRGNGTWEYRAAGNSGHRFYVDGFSTGTLLVQKVNLTARTPYTFGGGTEAITTIAQSTGARVIFQTQTNNAGGYHDQTFLAVDGDQTFQATRTNANLYFDVGNNIGRGNIWFRDTQASGSGIDLVLGKVNDNVWQIEGQGDENTRVRIKPNSDYSPYLEYSTVNNNNYIINDIAGAIQYRVSATNVPGYTWRQGTQDLGDFYRTNADTAFRFFGNAQGVQMTGLGNLEMNGIPVTTGAYQTDGTTDTTLRGRINNPLLIHASPSSTNGGAPLVGIKLNMGGDRHNMSDLAFQNHIDYSQQLRLKFGGTAKESGTTDLTLTNKLVDSTQTFISTGLVQVGDRAFNWTDHTSAIITSIDSETELTVDANIFTTGELYSVGTNTWEFGTNGNDNNIAFNAGGQLDLCSEEDLLIQAKGDQSNIIFRAGNESAIGNRGDYVFLDSYTNGGYERGVKMDVSNQGAIWDGYLPGLGGSYQWRSNGSPLFGTSPSGFTFYQSNRPDVDAARNNGNSSFNWGRVYSRIFETTTSNLTFIDNRNDNAIVYVRTGNADFLGSSGILAVRPTEGYQQLAIGSQELQRDTGVTDGAASNKLIDSTATFITSDLFNVGDIVFNETTGSSTRIDAIDSETQLSVQDNIFSSGQNYRIEEDVMTLKATGHMNLRVHSVTNQYNSQVRFSQDNAGGKYFGIQPQQSNASSVIFDGRTGMSRIQMDYSSSTPELTIRRSDDGSGDDGTMREIFKIDHDDTNILTSLQNNVQFGDLEFRAGFSGTGTYWFWDTLGSLRVQPRNNGAWYMQPQHDNGLDIIPSLTFNPSIQFRSDDNLFMRLQSGHGVDFYSTASNVGSFGWSTNDFENNKVSLMSLSYSGKTGGGIKSSGTTDSFVANKLNDSTATFITDGVIVGDRVFVNGSNTRVTAVDSETQLSLENNYSSNGVAYEVRQWSARVTNLSLGGPVAQNTEGTQMLNIGAIQFGGSAAGGNFDPDPTKHIITEYFGGASGITLRGGSHPNSYSNAKLGLPVSRYAIGHIHLCEDTLDRSRNIRIGVQPNFGVNGTITSLSTGLLIDAAATFITDGVQVGDTVVSTGGSFNYTGSFQVNGYKEYTVSSVDSETQLTLSGDAFINVGDSYWLRRKDDFIIDSAGQVDNLVFQMGSASTRSHVIVRDSEQISNPRTDLALSSTIDNTTKQTVKKYVKAVEATLLIDANGAGETIYSAPTGHTFSPNFVKVRRMSGSFAQDLIFNVGVTGNLTKFATGVTIPSGSAAGFIAKIETPNADAITDIIITITQGSGAGGGQLRSWADGEEMEDE
ncbi:MAG: hypothetical protein JRJ68_03260 [Deltaproteobacteria bacterium]|nr:hypothetical protein [Deltaproteobacteria bacterium]